MVDTMSISALYNRLRAAPRDDILYIADRYSRMVLPQRETSENLARIVVATPALRRLFAAAYTVLRFMRRTRRPIVNPSDPFTLEDIQRDARLFTYMRNNHMYACDPDTLAAYVGSSGNLRDPFANLEFTDAELGALDQLTGFRHALVVKRRTGMLARIKAANTNTHDAQALVVGIIEDIATRFMDILEQLKEVNPYSRIAMEAQVLSTTLIDELNSLCSQSSQQFHPMIIRALDQIRGALESFDARPNSLSDVTRQFILRQVGFVRSRVGTARSRDTINVIVVRDQEGLGVRVL